MAISDLKSVILMSSCILFCAAFLVIVYQAVREARAGWARTRYEIKLERQLRRR